MSKRGSGPPRRPRNPVAKAVRTPAFRMRVVPDKRWQERLQEGKRERDETAEDGKDNEPEA
ncbi:MAG: hypothetical protein P4L70_05030 [Parasulfuritortus sp.]|nr:hypothetical protein [Parasulfuritortus sp.]